MPLYVGNIWVLTFLVDQRRFVKKIVLGMEELFKPRDIVVRIEHVRVTSRLLN